MQVTGITPGMHRLAVVTAVATWVLVCIGGLVTSHGVGMAVPDWPNTYGYNLFFFPLSQWVGGIFYEHTHRLAASAVGFLSTLLVLWVHGRASRRVLRWGGLLLIAGAGAGLVSQRVQADSCFLGVGVGVVAVAVSLFWPACPPAPRWLRGLAWAAFIGVVLQGVLGGLRVVLSLDVLGAFHGTLAQLFLLLVAVICLFTHRKFAELKPALPLSAGAFPLAPGFAGVTLLIVVQLGLGAAMRHRHAGLAIPDFPLAHGRLWPATDAESLARYNRQREEVRALNEVTAGDVWLQMGHRLVALGVLAGMTAAAVQAVRRRSASPAFARTTVAWAALGWVQLGLGAATIWTNKSADIATAHVAVGSLILVGGGLLTLAGDRLFPRASALAREALPVPVAPAPGATSS